jgi:hypothetical protein
MVRRFIHRNYRQLAAADFDVLDELDVDLESDFFSDLLDELSDLESDFFSDLLDSELLDSDLDDEDSLEVEPERESVR